MEARISDLLAAACPEELPNPAVPDTERLRGLVLDRISRPKRRSRRVGGAVLLAAALCALLGVGALAAVTGGLDWLRGRIDPDFIDEVEPVEQSVTDEGIELGVIAAQKFGDQAIYYVSLRDTEGLGRIDASTSPSISGGASTAYRFLYYDEASGTAVFEVRANNTEYDGGTAPLKMSSLGYDERRIEPVPLGIELANLPAVSAELFAGPGKEPLCEIPGSEGAYLYAAAYSGGELEVGFYETLGAGVYRELWAYLLTESGERVGMIGQSRVDTGDYKRTRQRIEIARGELAGCELYFEGSVYSELCGDWEIRVDFDETQGVLEAETDAALGEKMLRDVTVNVSPLGVVADVPGFKATDGDLGSLEVVLVTAEGELELGGLCNIYYGGDAASICWPVDVPLDVGSVEALRIGGSLIEFN